MRFQTLVALVAGIFNCGIEAASVHAQATHAQQPRLVGARPTIEAIDYESIQAALDAVPKAGGLVRLPAGEFEITEPLRIATGDTRIEGAGAATHIINRNETGKPAWVIAHPDGAEVAAKDRLWRVNLANLRVSGNEKSGAGIHAIQIEEILIQGVTITRNGGDGIYLESCYEDPRVSDCLLTYNGQVGLRLTGCHDIVVSANQFEENQDALHCVDGFNLCMTGNNIDDHLDRGVLIENTYGSVLSGNMIEECHGAEITLDRDCYGITISANVIAHNGAGVALKDAHGSTVSANTFTIMKEDALRIGPQSSRITVSGNNFSNSHIGDEQVKRAENDLAAAGLVLDSTSFINVTGNTFSNVSPKAITLLGDNRELTFGNNQIVESDSDQHSDQ